MNPLSSRALFLSREGTRCLPSLFHQTHNFSKFRPPRNVPSSVPVSVWWNFEDCRIPTEMDGSVMEMNIIETLKSNGINGHIEINAFGDFEKLSSPERAAIASLGPNITHIPRDKKLCASDANECLLLQTSLWTWRNPPPAHVLLVTNKRNIAYMLSSLMNMNYNTMLASTKSMPDVVLRAATIVWDWPSFVKGEVSGKNYMRRALILIPGMAIMNILCRTPPLEWNRQLW